MPHKSLHDFADCRTRPHHGLSRTVRRIASLRAPLPHFKASRRTYHPECCPGPRRSGERFAVLKQVVAAQQKQLEYWSHLEL